MGRLAREKRLMMEQANRVLSNEEVVGKTYTFTDGNGKQYQGTVGEHYGSGVGVYLEVSEEIAAQHTDKHYENGSLSVDLSPSNGILINNMSFNKFFGGGLKQDELMTTFKS